MRNADGVRNLRKIIDDEQNLFIIVSAMGKTTNALEKVFEGVQKGDKDLSLENVAALREYHAGIINDLWHGPKKLESRCPVRRTGARGCRYGLQARGC